MTDKATSPPRAMEPGEETPLRIDSPYYRDRDLAGSMKLREAA